MGKYHDRRVVGGHEGGRGVYWSVRRGVTGTDVIVLVVLFFLAVLVILMVLPRGREHARMAGCENNLAHVGFALAVFDQMSNRLPGTEGIDALDSPREGRTQSVLRTMLEALVQPDFRGLTDAKARPEPRPGEVPGEMPVPGFICASDPNATSGIFLAPISYRACTGDLARGGNGAFAPGRKISLREIQEGDGMSYTALFSERLVGDNLSNHAAAINYMIVDGPLPAEGCAGRTESARWRGDAGSSWVSSDYRSTLYNHALRPNGQPSCIDGGGKGAFVGASSGHIAGVNLLFGDGHVAVMSSSIDGKIWREFARIGSGDDGL
jgi:prepilin-type processing-associated H-X9-DG protein